MGNVVDLVRPGLPVLTVREEDLHPQRFEKADAQLLKEAGVPYAEGKDPPAGHACPAAPWAGHYVRVERWVGDLWVKLPHGSQVIYMRALLRDPELAAAALSVLDLGGARKGAALEALLDEHALGWRACQ